MVECRNEFWNDVFRFCAGDEQVDPRFAPDLRCRVIEDAGKCPNRFLFCGDKHELMRCPGSDFGIGIAQILDQSVE